MEAPALIVRGVARLKVLTTSTKNTQEVCSDDMSELASSVTSRANGNASVFTIPDVQAVTWRFDGTVKVLEDRRLQPGTIRVRARSGFVLAAMIHEGELTLASAHLPDARSTIMINGEPDHWALEFRSGASSYSIVDDGSAPADYVIEVPRGFDRAALRGPTKRAMARAS